MTYKYCNNLIIICTKRKFNKVKHYTYLIFSTWDEGVSKYKQPHAQTPHVSRIIYICNKFYHWLRKKLLSGFALLETNNCNFNRLPKNISTIYLHFETPSIGCTNSAIHWV